MSSDEAYEKRDQYVQRKLLKQQQNAITEQKNITWSM
jgi:hypothetical protein